MASTSNSTSIVATAESEVSSQPTSHSLRPGKSFLLNHLPSWVPANLNRASYKLLVRSWLAAWAAFVLIIPNRSLNTFGNAAFFACMSSVMVPPAFPVQVYFYAMALMVLGSLLGWAWGCAAMKAALTVRNQILLLSEIQTAEQTAAAAANPDAMFNLEVFQGKFLDTSSSIVYGVFLAIGCFFFAISRVYFSKLALFSVFGTIFLDIICSYGPLFPAADYTILKSFLIATSASVAIGCVVIVLVFPESLNHQMLTGVSKLLSVLRQLVEVQDKVLTPPDTKGLAPGSQLFTQIQTMTAGTYGGIEKLNAGIPMLSLEFSFGRFNGEDIRVLIEPLTVLVSRIAGLQNFSKLINTVVLEENTTDLSPATPSFKTPSSGYLSVSDDLVRGADGYLWRELHNGSHPTHGDPGRRAGLEEILPFLHTATADLRAACVNGLQIAETLITRVNTSRWRKPIDTEPDIDRQLDELRRVVENFKQNRRLEVLEPFKHLTISVKDEKALPYRVLFYAFVFQANLVWVTDAIIGLLEVLAETADRRPKARFWAPRSLRSLWKVLATNGDKATISLDLPPLDDPIEAERVQTVHNKRNPDSRPPTNVFQHVGAFLHKCYKWCSTPQAIYAFKYTFVSVVLWLPGVFRTSALINYVDKGIWALIMAQTTLEPFIADQIYSYFARLTATTAGIGIGLAGWYIGAGDGGGNPFGIAAVMGVLLVPLMFWRIFTPSPIPSIMNGVTIILVIGYSWIDSHLQLVGNPGVGWSVAWRRWLLVLIGSGASAVMMIVPPKSAKTAVRLANASMVFKLSQLYSLLISKWIMTEEATAKSKNPSKEVRHMSRWSRQFRADFAKAGAKLQALKTRTSLAQWEGSIRGAWPVDQYNELNDVETEMLSYLAQLAGAVYHMDPVWRMSLLHRTNFLNPNFIAEVMSVFLLVSRSLRTGEPLQETLPKNLVDRVFYHHRLRKAGRHRDDERDTTTDEHWDQLQSLEYMAFAAGVTAVYKILSLLDRLHAITVDLCGETPLQGFSEWKDIHEMENIHEYT